MRILRKNQIISKADLNTISLKASQFFLFLPIIVYVLGPSSNSGLASLSTWADQSTYVVAYNEWQISGASGWLTNNWLGPGFFALMKLLSLAFGSVQVSLVLATFLGIMISIGFLMHQVSAARKKTLLIVFLVYFVLATHVQVFKDIPWTHFWVLPMLICAIIFLYNQNSTKLRIFFGGFLLAFSWQIRNFETLALLVSMVVVAACVALFDIRHGKYQIKKELKNIIFIATGTISGFLFVGVISSQFKIYRQYNSSNDFSDMPPSLDLNLINFIERAIQIFFNPTYQSLSSSNAYSVMPISNQAIVRAEELSTFWGQSLSRQQPFLFPLILLSLLITVITTRYLFSKKIDTHYFKLINAPGICGILIVGGYLSQPIIGVGHLKYGIAREFLLPQFLFALQAIVVFAKNYTWISKALKGALALSAVSLLFTSFPDLSYSDYKFKLDERCNVEQECSSNIQVRLQSGTWKKLGEETIYIRDTCEGKDTFYYGKSNRFVLAKCSGDHYVSMIPTSFGIAATPDASAPLDLRKLQIG